MLHNHIIGCCLVFAYRLYCVMMETADDIRLTWSAKLTTYLHILRQTRIMTYPADLFVYQHLHFVI